MNKSRWAIRMRRKPGSGGLLPGDCLARNRRSKQTIMAAAVMSGATEPECHDWHGAGRYRDCIRRLQFAALPVGSLRQHFENHRI
jgi:hypothetical protein